MSTSSASEREISEGSSSPNSYTLRDSPYSSPSQQIPQLTSHLTELKCSDRSFPFSNNGTQPQLCIVEQAQNHFRFRYVSEMVGTHGCLLGTTTGKTKTHPTVELLNYTGRALIRCRLAQCDSDEEHPHRLLEDDQDRDVSSYVPQHNSYRVSFAGMGIIHTAKKDVPSLLMKKYSEKFKGQSYNPKTLRTECENLARKINLNIVRLKFSAHDETGKEICEPVFSEPIHNMKSAATNDLKICRISQYSGRPRGGEDVFILVEKVNKKNIMVRFVELDENGVEVWSENGVFLQSDVHHQYAIVFRTPPYRDPQTPVDVKVYIELARPSDGRTSERKPFTYKAEQVYKQIKKRKNNSYSSLDSSSGGSITNEIPTTVLFQNSNDTADDAEMPLFTIKPLTIPTGSPGHCGLGSALGTINIPTMKENSPINAIHSPNSMTSPNYVINSLVTAITSPNHMINSPVMAMTCANDMINSPNVITSSQATPMWSGADVTAVVTSASSIPNFSLHSAELERIINEDVPPGEQKPSFIAEYFNLYTNSDMQTEEQNSFGDFIRTSSGLVADSGRVKDEASSSSNSSTHSADQNASENKPHVQSAECSDYDAFYKPEDGLEVKKLVQDLCQIIRNKKGYKNQEVKAKLERLFQIRLSNGDTFLHMTLRSNQPSFESIVKVIASVNMSHLLNYGNHKQLTILHLAVLYGNPKLISLLVSKGCNPMLRNSEDDNVVQYAVRYSSKLLEPLLVAVQKYNVPCDLNACNSEKQTALHLAALGDDEVSARLLVAHGARSDARDAAGRSPLHLAALDGKPRALRALAETSDIDAVDGSGNTALQIVCGRTAAPSDVTTLEMVEFLLRNKADPLKHEEYNESAWRLSRGNPGIRAVMKMFNNDADLEDDVKSEPEDEFESADEDIAETGLPELSQYIHQLSEKLDSNGAWQELAIRMRVDALTNWFATQDSPTFKLLKHVRDYRETTSKSLILMLEDMGQNDAANIVRGCLESP